MSQRSKSLKRLKDLNDAELAKESADLRHDVWKLALQRATGQTADTSKLTLKKRELARALTILGERHRAANR